MKATSHPKLVIDVDSEFKQLLIDICQIQQVSIKAYVLECLQNKMDIDSEELVEKLELMRRLRTG